MTPTRDEARERLARIIDPEAWAFADRHRNGPFAAIMGVEIDIETKPSFAKADAILALLSPEVGRLGSSRLSVSPGEGMGSSRDRLIKEMEYATSMRNIAAGLHADVNAAWLVLEKIAGEWVVIESDGWTMTIQGPEEDPGEMVVDTRARTVDAGSDQPQPTTTASLPGSRRPQRRSPL